MCYGGSPQAIWGIYSECVKEVLLRKSGEYTANVLGRFSSGDLGIYSECVREVLLRRSGEYTANVLGWFSSGDLGNIQ